MAVGPQKTRKIGRYEVVRKIATGGMAELFLARFVGPGGFEKRCALKRILPQLAADRTFTRMFLTEARVTAMFDHPNLVQIFELGQDEQGQFFIAMELVNGMNLRQLLQLCQEKGIRLPAELAAYMMSQALDGLAYAHEFKDPDGSPLKLVHRDVSPQNILVSYEGAVKVVDFGIVKGSSISGETLAGMLKGKVAYMSPEQASGEPIDGRSDLFSIGVCLYELIAGQKPFTGANEIMCLKSILEDAPPPLAKHAPDCPEAIARAIERALEKSRDARFPTARDFQLELQAILKDCPTPLGRHVVAEFIRSLTGDVTSGPFDPSKLKLPGSGPHSNGSIGRSPSAVSSSSPSAKVGNRATDSSDGGFERSAGSGPRAAHGPGPLEHHGEITRTETPGLSDRSASDPRSLTMDATGLTAEIRAAGIGRLSPVIVLVFVASTLGGGLGVWLFTRRDEPVMIEVVEPARTGPAGTEGSPGLDGTTLSPDPPATTVIRTSTVARTTLAPSAPSSDPRSAPPSDPAKGADGPAVSRKPKPDAPLRATRRRSRDPDLRDAASGTLTLTSVPRGLTVSLNERTLGKTPLVGVVLPAGSHTLSLASKPLGISRRVSVKISKGALTTENLAIGKGTLKVVSRPWSEVFVDGVPKGKTPLETPVYEGSHEVRLVSPESGERIQKIDVASGATETLRVRF